MPHFIAKLKPDRYCIWSTIVDAPVTYGMSREALAEYYDEHEAAYGVDDFAERMHRVDQKGVSAYFVDSVEDLVRGNRAGPDETELSLRELREKYC